MNFKDNSLQEFMLKYRESCELHYKGGFVQGNRRFPGKCVKNNGFYKN